MKWIRIGKEQYPYTQAQWERHLEYTGQVANAGESVYTDSK